MKKVINAPERVVEDMLRGMELAHGGLIRVLPESNVVVRADAPVEGKVALVSGGGSGHEPTHGGFVGPGMLDAACAGAVFTSPTPDQMFEASKAVDGGAGVFYVVKNYTGDVLNFEMSGELAEAEGIETDYVVTNDDVAVEDSTYTSGRRGIAGTVFVDEMLQKILGDSVDFSGSEVAVIINGMGGTPLMELYVAYAHVHDVLEREGVQVWRMPYVGDYMTSLEMAGFSITLLKLDDEMKGYLEAPCDVAAGRPF